MAGTRAAAVRLELPSLPCVHAVHVRSMHMDGACIRVEPLKVGGGASVAAPGSTLSFPALPAPPAPPVFLRLRVPLALTCAVRPTCAVITLMELTMASSVCGRVSALSRVSSSTSRPTPVGRMID